MTNNKEKKYDNIRWAVTFAVVFVLVISTVLLSLQAFTDIKPFDVFKNTGENETVAYSIVTDENGNELEEGTIHSMPAVLNITSNALALADNNFIEILLTATVTPSSAMNKAVDWSVGYADGSDKSDIADYLTVTPTSDGSNIVSVKCYKPFTKDMVITVVTREGGFSASCTVRYIGVPSTLEITFNGVEKDTDGAYVFEVEDQNKSFTAQLSLSNIFGAITNYSTSYSVTVEDVGEVTNDLVCIDYYSSKWGYHTYESMNEAGASSRQLVHDSMNFSISGNTLKAAMTLVPFTHYDSTESEGDNLHYNNRVAFKGLADLLYPSPSENYEWSSKNSINNYANQNVTAIESQKIKVTVTETNSGTSASFYFKYKYVAQVSGVSLSKTEITF